MSNLSGENSNLAFSFCRFYLIGIGECHQIFANYDTVVLCCTSALEMDAKINDQGNILYMLERICLLAFETENMELLDIYKRKIEAYYVAIPEKGNRLSINELEWNGK